MCGRQNLKEPPICTATKNPFCAFATRCSVYCESAGESTSVGQSMLSATAIPYCWCRSVSLCCHSYVPGTWYLVPGTCFFSDNEIGVFFTAINGSPWFSSRRRLLYKTADQAPCARWVFVHQLGAMAEMSLFWRQSIHAVQLRTTGNAAPTVRVLVLCARTRTCRYSFSHLHGTCVSCTYVKNVLPQRFRFCFVIQPTAVCLLRLVPYIFLVPSIRTRIAQPHPVVLRTLEQHATAATKPQTNTAEALCT